MPNAVSTRSKRSEKGGESARTQPRKDAKKPFSAGSKRSLSIVNYATALRWLYDHTDHERQRIVHYNNRSFSLERMRRLLDLLGNPHDQLKCVQVAGTKGKGSTCTMLSNMLRRNGFTVGLYTSPHLVDLRERIMIDGQMIAHSDLVDTLRTIEQHQGKLAKNPPSFFDILTAAALRHFAEQAVDIAVLETGLGGRLDSVTVCSPLVTGLAQISLDHMNVLGRDLPTIAREKAGIMKRGVPTISVEQESSVMRVFDEVAQHVGSPLEYLGKTIDFSFRFEANRELGPHTRVCITTPTSRWEHLPVPLRGEHQAHNCGLALAMLDKLKACGFEVTEEHLVAGLSETKLPGRMEQVWNEPRIIVDGAHNAASITALTRALGAHVSYDSLVLIFGCGQDKDVTGMLKQLALGADKIIFTRAKNNPRAAEPEELQHKFNELSGKMSQTAPSFEDALRLATRAVSREDLIVVTGSFYLVGEAKKLLEELAAKRARTRV